MAQQAGHGERTGRTGATRPTAGHTAGRDGRASHTAGRDERVGRTTGRDGRAGQTPHVVEAVAGTPDDLSEGITRRRFLWFGGATALTLALSGPMLTGCRSERGDEIFRHTRTIIDDADREVTIPTADTIERVYFTSGLAEVYMFTLNPDLIVGNSAAFDSKQMEYLPERLGELPVLGSLSGNGEIDREELLAKDVQIVFSISGVGLTAENISDAQELQDATGIPCVLVDGSFDKIAQAYRFLGDILGTTDRAEELAVFLENIYNDVTAAVGDVPEEDKPTLYYAEGPLGTQTEPNVSQHALTFLIGGARNVAAEGQTQELGMTQVNLEQILKWNPEVIVAWDSVWRGGADQIIRTSESWATIDAVKNGRVYTMPNAPFAWCDRPPGVNRFIGIQWVANMLHPDLYDVDMVEEAQKYYKTVYNYDLSTDRALDLLGNSYPPYGKEAKYTYSEGYEPDTSTSTGLSQDDMTERQSGGY
jgi:iron complex transport system substrate-binding protein